jgi:hypothetical protein
MAFQLSQLMAQLAMLIHLPGPLCGEEAVMEHSTGIILMT